MTSYLRSVTVKGYTSIRAVELDLGRLNVLVGANGSGKSNFISALELLGRIVDEQLQRSVRTRGGASLLHEPKTGRIEFGVASLTNQYHAALEATRDDRILLSEETRYLSPRKQDWTSRVIGEARLETALHERLERNGEGESVESYVVDMLRGCRVYHFHDTSPQAPVKQPVATGDSMSLHADASNLAAVLHLLHQRSQATYREILGTIRQAAPFFGDFVLEPEGETDRIRLRWRHVESDRVFSAHQLSDGTLRFICLATLLLNRKQLPALVVLDEPELGLHPFAIVQLAEMLRAASTARQVVVATQSVTLIDQIELSDLVVVEREHGASVFRRPPVNELRAWLDDYSVGDLWQKALIGGRPTRETR